MSIDIKFGKVIIQKELKILISDIYLIFEIIIKKTSMLYIESCVHRHYCL